MTIILILMSIQTICIISYVFTYILALLFTILAESKVFPTYSYYTMTPFVTYYNMQIGAKNEMHLSSKGEGGGCLKYKILSSLLLNNVLMETSPCDNYSSNFIFSSRKASIYLTLHS